MATEHIIIDSQRNIFVPESVKKIGVQYDHNVNTITFDCPRYWDEHDMSAMDIYITYKFADTDVYDCKAINVTIDEADSMVMHFDWPISSTVTMLAGNIYFMVCIKKDVGIGELLHWNSELNHDLYVSEGLDCDNTVQDVNNYYEAGKKAAYDEFWDAYQNNGGVMDGYYGFSGSAWNDAAYNPKYNIKANNFTNMFRGARITDTKVTIDLSEGTGIYVFNNAINLVNIPKIIVNENIEYTGWFAACAALEEIRFEGVIGNDLDIHWSTKLSAESIANILSCLSPNTTGKVLTLPISAPGIYDEKYSDTTGGWGAQIEAHSNWEFKYA